MRQQQFYSTVYQTFVDSYIAQMPQFYLSICLCLCVNAYKCIKVKQERERNRDQKEYEMTSQFKLRSSNVYIDIWYGVRVSIRCSLCFNRINWHIYRLCISFICILYVYVSEYQRYIQFSIFHHSIFPISIVCLS